MQFSIVYATRLPPRPIGPACRVLCVCGCGACLSCCGVCGSCPCLRCPSVPSVGRGPLRASVLSLLFLLGGPAALCAVVAAFFLQAMPLRLSAF